MIETVYRSRHLLVRAARRSSRCCFVTFDPFTDSVDLDRVAFGETFFADQDISAVHVINARNTWYHESDWRAAIDAAGDQASRYARIVSYGASMGGYAALRFADHLRAHAVLALSPQYSLDPRKAPFKTRWGRHHRHRWLAELSGALPATTPAIIAYDPMAFADREHVERIAAEVPLEPLTLPHSGHSSVAFLAECGVLSHLMLSIGDGDLDLRPYHSLARARRKQALHYLVDLSDHAFRRGRHQVALDLARRATDTMPQSDLAWDHLGRLFSRLERPVEALRAHERAAQIAPRSGVVQLEYALAQRRNGDYHGALCTLGRLQELGLPKDARRLVAAEIWKTRVLRVTAKARKCVPFR